MDIKINNKENRVILDFKNDLIISDFSPVITMKGILFNEKSPKITIENATYVCVKEESKLKTLIKLIKFVYRK